MSIISDFIVYLWLLPVVAQILIPLALLLGFTVAKVVRGVSKEGKIAGNNIADYTTPAG